MSALEPWLAQMSTSPSAISVDWSALLTGDRLVLSSISLVLTLLFFLKVALLHETGMPWVVSCA